MTDDPRTSRPTSFPDEPQQPRPGLTTSMKTKPDHGEESYVGKGLLTGKVALVTGGDSGIGRAVAIAYAREGANVAICYLADEQPDAEDTLAWVEKAGRRCLLLPGDLRDRDHCTAVVEQTVATLGGLDILVNNAAAQTMNRLAPRDVGERIAVEPAFGRGPRAGIQPQRSGEHRVVVQHRRHERVEGSGQRSVRATRRGLRMGRQRDGGGGREAECATIEQLDVPLRFAPAYIAPRRAQGDVRAAAGRTQARFSQRG